MTHWFVEGILMEVSAEVVETRSENRSLENEVGTGGEVHATKVGCTDSIFNRDFVTVS